MSYRSLILIIIFQLSTAAKGQSLQWVSSVDPVDITQRIMKVDAAGNVYTCGYFENATDFDPGPGVEQLDPGVAQGSMYLLKLDPNGNFLWAKQIGSTYICKPRDMVLDQNGNIFILGAFLGYMYFGSNLIHASSDGTGFVMKLDNSGGFSWAETLEEHSFRLTTMVADSIGNIIVGGDFKNTVDLDFGPGVDVHTASSGKGLFLFKLDVAGDFLWSRHIPLNIPGSGDQVGSLTTDPEQNLIFTVHTTVSQDVYKYNSAGWPLWTQPCNNGPAAFLSGVRTDVYGNILVMTSYQDSVSVTKLGVNGHTMWSHTIYGNNIFEFDVTTDNSGSVYVSGNFFGSIDLNHNKGSVAMSQQGPASNVFLAKLAYWGDLIYSGQETGIVTMSHIGSSADGALYITGGCTGDSDLDPGGSVYNIDSTSNYSTFFQKLSSTLSVRESYVQHSAIKVYPNPSLGEFSISSPDRINSIMVTDALGKIIHESVPVSTRVDMKLDAADGVYYLNAETVKGNVVEKVVIAK